MRKQPHRLYCLTSESERARSLQPERRRVTNSLSQATGSRMGVREVEASASTLNGGVSKHPKFIQPKRHERQRRNEDRATEIIIDAKVLKAVEASDFEKINY